MSAEETDEQFVERMQREKGLPTPAEAERLRRIERKKQTEQPNPSE